MNIYCPFLIVFHKYLPQKSILNKRAIYTFCGYV
nr:MAG TPA_asm: hypothetical protein [Bacteriophage sp.]